MKSNKIIKWVVGGIFYTVFVFSVGYCKADRDAKKEHLKELENLKKTIKDNEAKLDTINNESDDDALRRFKQNFGTN